MREWCNNGIAEGFSDKFEKIFSDRLYNWKMARIVELVNEWMEEWWKGNNEMNEWDTNERVEWWNGGIMEVWKDVIMFWQNIRIM